jgi:hypothetical protein
MPKRRTALRLLLEFAAIAVVMAGAAIGIYYGFRAPPIHDKLPLGGPNVDVSRSEDAQFEAAVASDPQRPRHLLAASMDGHLDARIYTSRDGGQTWRSAIAPPEQRAPCGFSHPSVAFGRGHLEVVASLVSDTCQPADPVLYVATRGGFAGPWHVRRVRGRSGYVFDQRPAVAIDDAGTLYVAWPELVGEFSSRQVLLFSRSDDAGATWSPATRVGRYKGVYGVDLVAGRSGELFLAVSDGGGGRIVVQRSTNGGASWGAQKAVAALPREVGCGAGATIVPAQPQRCVSDVARIALGRTRVAVAYGGVANGGRHDVFVSTIDRTFLERAFSGSARVAPSEPHSVDRFLPTITYDRSTGALWACYYDTFGDPARKHAWYTCTVSRDGARTWARPVHASSGKSDETVTGAQGYGDAEGLVAFDGAAHPVWTDSRNSLRAAEEIYTARITASRLLRPRRATHRSPRRGSRSTP